MSMNIDKELEEIKRLINTDQPGVPASSSQPPRDNSAKAGQTQRSVRPANGRKPSRKRRRNKVNWRLIVLAAGAVLLILLTVLMLRNCSGSNPLEGTWDMDGTTIYRFDADGTGAMILPSSTYLFSYSVDAENGTITIDFEDERATDFTYSYKLEKDKLVFFGSVGKESFSYEFNRLAEE